MSKSDKSISDLPVEARMIWQDAHDAAMAEYADPARASRVAWGIVKKAGYLSQDGRWPADRKFPPPIPLIINARRGQALASEIVAKQAWQSEFDQSVGIRLAKGQDLSLRQVEIIAEFWEGPTRNMVEQMLAGGLAGRDWALETLEKAKGYKGGKQPRWPSGSAKGGQWKGKGSIGGPGGQGSLFSGMPKKVKGEVDDDPPPKKLPRQDKPETTPFDDIGNPEDIAVFAPGVATPATLNGVPFTSWSGPPGGDFSKIPDNFKNEPPLPTLPVNPYTQKPKRLGAGVIVEEADGRIWTVEPTQHFGGYKNTFPKGGIEKGLSLQQTAIKEAWEESGLQVKITGFVGDFEGDTSVARYYRAERIGGSPADAHWETQGVRLVPPDDLVQHFNRKRDRDIAEQYLGVNKADTIAKGGSWAWQARAPSGTKIGGQWIDMGKGIYAAKLLESGEDYVPLLSKGKNPNNSALVASNKKGAAIAALANEGDVQGLMALKAPPVPGPKANPYQKTNYANYVEGIAYAKGKQAAAEAPLPKPVKAKAKPKAKPAAKPDAEAKPAQTVKATTELSDLTYQAPKPGGSAAGAIYKDAKGDQYLIKNYKTDDQAKNEVLAAKLYELAGVKVPEMSLINTQGNFPGGKIGVASKMVSEYANVGEDPTGVAKKIIGKDFAADAWLANWDAVGLSYDNVGFGSVKGESPLVGGAVRIDPGGALLFRAQGTPKGKAFGTTVTEIDTLRDPKLNPTAAAVFGSMTNSQIVGSISKVAAIDPKAIYATVMEYGPGSPKDRADLAAKLIARQADLISKAQAMDGNFSADQPYIQANAAASPKNIKAAQDGKPIPKPEIPQPDAPKSPVDTGNADSGSFDLSAITQHANFSGKSASFYNAKLDQLAQSAAAGDIAGLNANIYVPKGKTALNSENYKAYQQGVDAAKIEAAKVAGANAAAADGTPVAPKVVATKPPPAMPTKPDQATMVTASNPNKKLLSKIDAIEAVASDYASGKISSDDAKAAVSAFAFSSNTYGKKAAAYQASVLAAMGGTVRQADDTPPKVSVKAQVAASKAEAKAAEASGAPKFRPERLTSPDYLDFENWGGQTGKGLSTKPDVNVANKNAVKAIHAVAITGDLIALKNMKIPATDATGKLTGKEIEPGSHPSQHVKAYFAQLVSEVAYQKNPPKKLTLTEGSLSDLLNKQAPKTDLTLPQAQAKGMETIGRYIVVGEPGALGKGPMPWDKKTKANGKIDTDALALQSQAGWKKLAKAQQSAIEGYTNGTYKAMNESIWQGNESGAAKTAKEALKAAAYELAPGTVLSRKIKFDDTDTADAFMKQMEGAVGKVLQDEGVISTSTNPASWSGQVHLKIHVGEGVKGLFVGTNSAGAGNQISPFASESEVVLPPGTRFLVNKITQGKGKLKSDEDGYGFGGKMLVEVIALPNGV